MALFFSACEFFRSLSAEEEITCKQAGLENTIFQQKSKSVYFKDGTLFPEKFVKTQKLVFLFLCFFFLLVSHTYLISHLGMYRNLQFCECIGLGGRIRDS